MHLGDKASADLLVKAIENASFPDSEEILSSDIDYATIPPLLEAIKSTRDDLSETVRNVSKQEAGDVDGWIAQAKKVQEDIARCKEDAHHIIQEHERMENLHMIRNEALEKSRLLQAEISFTEILEEQIRLIAGISADLSKIETGISQRKLISAAQTLPSLKNAINDIQSDQPRTLLGRLQSDIEQRLGDHLREELDSCFVISVLESDVQLRIVEKLSENVEPPSQDSDNDQTSPLSLHQILQPIESLNLLESFTAQIFRKIDSTILSHLHKRSKLRIFRAEDRDETLHLELSSGVPSPTSTISVVSRILRYLHRKCPANLRDPLVRNVLSRVVPLLIANWLDAAIPVELEDLKGMDDLLVDVNELEEWLIGNGYGEATHFQDWIDQVPNTWFSKRRTFSLDAVRRAFKLADGSTRQVERIESQTINVEEEPQTSANEDDWDDNWDDEDQAGVNEDEQPASTGDDGSDAWGFDTDDQQDSTSEQLTTKKQPDQEQEDETDAWGWGDDEDPNSESTTSKNLLSTQTNGKQASRVDHKNIVLRENYMVTDIPMYIIEQIGRDLSDHQRLSSSPTTYFKVALVPPEGLSSLPILTLAMYRALAVPSYRSEFLPALSNMNIYNDALFLASKLSSNDTDFSVASRSSKYSTKSEALILEKFARQVYTSELSTHRTILLDLLDTAQGFVSCTRSPYAETCETAVSSTTDHIRALHKEWSHILSPSHLCQSIGSLLNSVMRKMIEDIEDMEDISEPESRKLLSLCEAVSTLQDLFVVRAPASRLETQDVATDGPMTTIAVHCTSYLRFQYLQQILESNLVEIRYLWTDAGLSLEFRPDEVVDLIEALFAESSQRRSAINAIKSGV